MSIRYSLLDVSLLLLVDTRLRLGRFRVVLLHLLFALLFVFRLGRLFESLFGGRFVVDGRFDIL